MKSVTILALAAGATAQVSLYAGIASAVNKQIDALNGAISSYTGGPSSGVIASASGLLSALQSGSSAAAKGQEITDLSNALSLLEPYQDVASSAKAVVANLISKHDVASKGNLGGVAYTIIGQESSAAVALAAVITGKLVDDAEAGRAIASGSVLAPIFAAFGSAKSAYDDIKDQKATGGSGSGSTSSEGGSTTSSGSDSTTTEPPSTSSDSGSEPPSTSSEPPVFTGTNAAAGYKVGGGLAAAVGALAYIL